MKQTKIICDRCGKEIDDGDILAIALVEDYNSCKLLKDTPTLDLCYECMEEFVEWLGGAK